ncbi:hypothetical protein NMG60_11032378 [Bertholletia excelsa]
MSRWRLPSMAFRWIDLNYFSPMTPIFRWPRLLSSLFTPSRFHSFSGLSPRWGPQNILAWWPDLNFSIVDDVVWSVVTAVESVALVSMLCFFYVFCGCTI